MEKCHAKATRFAQVVLLSVLCALTAAPPAALAAGAADYIGKKIEVDSEGYANGTVYGSEIIEKTPTLGESRMLGAERRRTPQGIIFLLTDDHIDAQRHVDWELVLNALDIPEGEALLGTSEDDVCSPEKQPNVTVLVLVDYAKSGLKNAKPGIIDRHSFLRAWRVDFDAKKMIEIPTTGITCEYRGEDAAD